MRSHESGDEEPVEASKFLFWQQHSQVFEGMAAYDFLGTGFNLTGLSTPEHITGIRVSADYFRVLGVHPTLGRGFTPDEGRGGGDHLVVISSNLWKQRFAGDPSLIGKPISLSGEPHTVVGVMPSGFRSRPPADIWVLLRRTFKPRDDEGPLFIVLGRLKAGISLRRAQADMEHVGKELRQTFPDLMGKDEKVAVVNYQEHLVGDVRPALVILLVAVGFVLLIACANVANLLLARATARRKEIAVRAALGADRLRLVRQLLAESTMLALVGGGLGLLVSSWALRGLVAVTPDSLPQFSDITIDGRVLTFTLLAALITGILFGLVPAFQTTGIDLNASLQEGGGRTTGSVRHVRVRSALVVAEIAFSLVLLVGSALLIQTFANLRRVKPGFDAHHVLTMKLSLTGTAYGTTAGVWSFFQRVVDRAEALPGVEAAGFVTNLPLELGPDQPFQVEGRQYSGADDAQFRAITPNYFRVMRIPLQQDRFFTEADNAQSSAVAIINETLARKYFPHRNPVGEHLTITGGERIGPREVVGVVGDVREEGLDNPPPATLFIPVAQQSDPMTAIVNRVIPASFVVRTKVAPMSVSAAVQKEVLAVDATQPAFNLRPMEELVAASITRQQFEMLLLGIFAALALLLATVGIYGLMSYSVSQRTHEIGLRTALGATQRDVLKLVVGQGLRLALVGTGIGLTVSLAVSHFLQTMLFGVKSNDPVTLVAVSLALTSVALLASYIPARRATKVDPMVALRHE
jgi:predicted permease